MDTRRPCAVRPLKERRAPRELGNRRNSRAAEWKKSPAWAREVMRAELGASAGAKHFCSSLRVAELRSPSCVERCWRCGFANRGEAPRIMISKEIFLPPGVFPRGVR